MRTYTLSLFWGEADATLSILQSVNPEIILPDFDWSEIKITEEEYMLLKLKGLKFKYFFNGALFVYD